MSFGQLKTSGGNFVSRLGGFGDDPGELLTKTELDNLSDAEFDAYKKQKAEAQQAGMRELAARLSDAFAGRDIAGRAQERKQLNVAREAQIKAEKRRKELEEIFKTNKLSDFATNREYYKNIGSELINKGYLDQGLKFIELGKPQSMEDLRKDLTDANNTETKQFETVKKGLTNFNQLLDAAKSEGGAGSYALMIKFIKQLDDSVVREGEVRSFGNFQGLYENLKNEVTKASGEGFTGATRARIVNLAQKTADALWSDWSTYKDTKSSKFYSPIGLNPELVFAGLDYDIESLNIGKDKTYTEEDFKDIKWKLEE